ncbi:MAG: LysR family transcriptional regulator [Gammaproteobacteria bacterium]
MLETIQTFVDVVEQRSFAKAAKKLRISPPVVTRRIVQLEEQLNIRLLQRNTRQVTVTEAGKLFYESCVHILETYQTTVKQIHHAADTISGSLKVGLPASINSLYVTPAINTFLQQYPALNIHIVQGNHLVDLLSNGFDLVMHCGVLPNSSFYSKLLGSWSKITCASPQYLDKHGISKQPTDLATHNCLDHIDNHSRVWRYNINSKLTDIPITGNLRLDSSLALKEAALADAGLVYLPSFTVKKELASHKLISVLTTFQPAPLNMYAIYPSKYLLSEKTKLFIEFLLSLDMAD